MWTRKDENKLIRKLRANRKAEGKCVTCAASMIGSKTHHGSIKLINCDDCRSDIKIRANGE